MPVRPRASARARIRQRAPWSTHARERATADDRVRSGPRAVANSRGRARIRARAQASFCEAWAARRSEGLRRPTTACGCGGARAFATVVRLVEDLLRAPAMARKLVPDQRYLTEWVPQMRASNAQ